MIFSRRGAGFPASVAGVWSGAPGVPWRSSEGGAERSDTLGVDGRAEGGDELGTLVNDQPPAQTRL